MYVIHMHLYNVYIIQRVDKYTRRQRRLLASHNLSDNFIITSYGEPASLALLMCVTDVCAQSSRSPLSNVDHSVRDSNRNRL